MMSKILNEERLVQAATRYVGSSDFYDRHCQTALKTLLTFLNEEACLSQTGVLSTFNSLLDALTKQFFLTTILSSHPEIAEIPIERLVFITGFPRSGTTLLHNLLAQSHPNHTLQLWEMRSFSLPTGERKEWEQEQIVQTKRFLENLYESAPIFKSIHPMQATWTDECNWLFRNSFSSMIYAIIYYIPNYLRWLLQQDLESVYTFYKRQLQFLLWRSPGRCLPGKSLILKDPFHLWHLDALLKVFPDARIIHLHRNISESLPSLCSLSYTLQGICNEHQNPLLLGRYCQEMIAEGMKRMLSVRSQVEEKNFMDISYYSLINDPVETVESIYRQLSWDFTRDAEIKMKTWLTQNKQHKAGKHHYSLEEFGLKKTEIQQDFSEYSNYFLQETLAA
ncbi:MAG: sulfotransferase [Symploca sp. SIO2B6]|nr:sulfotransferase [Symploca sp. SIO2B6]